MIEDTGQRLTAESAVERIMNECAEHGWVSAQCAHDPEHPCVIVWSENAREYLAAILDEYADGREARP